MPFFEGACNGLSLILKRASTHILALLSVQPSRRRERAPVLLEDEF